MIVVDGKVKLSVVVMIPLVGQFGPRRQSHVDMHTCPICRAQRN